MSYRIWIDNDRGDDFFYLETTKAGASKRLKQALKKGNLNSVTVPMRKRGRIVEKYLTRKELIELRDFKPRKKRIKKILSEFPQSSFKGVF